MPLELHNNATQKTSEAQVLDRKLFNEIGL